MQRTGRKATAGLRWAVFAMVVVLVVVTLHARGWPGGFLSDDFSHLDWIHRADLEHRLGEWTLQRFWQPLASGNFAWRPLAFASYVLDWRLFGTTAAGWQATNLALHLANVALVGGLAWKWLPQATASRAAAAAISAAVLAAFPFAGEVTFWLVGRFDLLAALFALSFLATFRSGRVGAGPWRQSLRVASLIGALLAKESAMPLPFVALPIAAALAASGADVPATGGALRSVKFAVRELLPAWIAFAGYALARQLLFGTPLKVYPASTFPHSLGELLDRIAPLAAVATRQPGEYGAPWAVALALSLALVTALVVADVVRRRPSSAPLAAALLVAAVAYTIAPASSFPVASWHGDGARSFYLPWLFVALAGGMAFAPGGARRALGALLVALLLFGQQGSLRQWHEAAATMRQVQAAVPGLARHVGPDGYALILLPDQIGVAVFVRNAQGGMVSRPTQADDHLDRVAGATWGDLPTWERRFTGDEPWAPKADRPFAVADYRGVYCWNPATATLVAIDAGGAIADRHAWRDALRGNALRLGCLPGTAGSVE
ncbi:MAG: hypothetical protein IPI40_01340 [Betaproteobacteria bacterium]|nr:hypothetical protein [Betaproteobacteria bacterium]